MDEIYQCIVFVRSRQTTNVLKPRLIPFIQICRMRVVDTTWFGGPRWLGKIVFITARNRRSYRDAEKCEEKVCISEYDHGREMNQRPAPVGRSQGEPKRTGCAFYNH